MVLTGGGNMEIKAMCTLNLETCKALVRTSMFFKNANPKRRMIIYSVFYLILLIILSAVMIVSSNIKTLFPLCVVAFVLLLECYMYFLLPKIRYNALGKMKDCVNEYTFRDDVFCVKTVWNDYKAEGEIGYSMITTVKETRRYLFVCNNKRETYVIDKNTIVGGTALELRDKLSCYPEIKYVVYNY